MRGAKCMYMYVKGLNLKFKDSLCFLPMALRKFSKTFNLPEEKGYFPHFFNTPANQDYVGSYPVLEFYGVETMKEEDAEKLRLWHTEQHGKTFHLQEELKHYCQQDVILLKRGVLEARRIFLDVTGFDPFVKCITLASACMWSYRYRFMPPNSIGIIPQGGYTPQDIQSLKAKKWLWRLEQQTPGLRLHTCYSVEGETSILGAKVDGYEPKTRTVYQFHGCFWHACPLCFTNAQMFHPKLRQKMGDIRNATEQRTRRMREWGFKVVEMWEHEWDGMQSDDNNDTFPQWMKHREPLNPREGLFGGRTNALKLHFKCPEGSRVDYVDFTSLYPSVMLSGGAYPVGHPTLIRRDFKSPLTEHYYGFNKVKVLPPRHLYIPVLPSHIQNKLMFVLCRTCAEQLRQTKGRCCHNTEERALVGTWTTPELKKAIALGYVILDVYEVWHYPETSLVLFGNLWGKFGQNPHLPVTEYVDDPKRFAELMFGPKTEVKHLLLINENLAQLQYDRVDDFTRESGFASVVHAAFVTSFARLKLYRYLEELQERVLYFDTDSIFYVTHPGQVLLPLGDYLGDLTSELKRPGDFIREFVSTGPKSYAYVTDQGEKEVKCKGIPLNVMSSAVINFKTMLRLVEGMEEKYVVTEPHRIQRDAKRRQLKTVEMSKDFRVVYTNDRVIVDGLDEQWQSDLVDVQRMSDDNQGYKHWLTCIDVLSRYAWVRPIKNKTAPQIIQAFQSIFKEGRQPKVLQTDQGTEFLNRHVQAFFKSQGIRHFVTYSDPKAQIVERFHRTIKNRLWRYFTAQNTQKYVDVLPEFVSGYNQAYHRSIRRSPDSVTYENAQEVWHTLYDDDVKITPRRRRFALTWAIKCV
ncbi:hypothetical protein QZH41_002810 [Actinostola sp. cb2023]|nr:hypothetical protein QZH41_002810 [Actinostola sp. cb2023]